MSYSTRVHTLARACLFQDSEQVDGKWPRDPVVVEGIIRTFGFDPVRLAANQAAIITLARELVPDEFYRRRGGGWSFLQLPFDRQGEQWGEHREAEALTCICIAIGIAGYCAPRDLWDVLPGGLPYIWFDIPETP